MISHWNSKNAILRDLSVAQGREVPVEIENPVASDEIPPALIYTEETEEEYFANCVGGGDFNAGPDFTLIQQMLDMVRETNIHDIEKDENTNAAIIVEISKTDPQLPGQSLDNRQKLESQNKKPRKKRNIAMESLIKIYGTDMKESGNLTNPELLEPDVISEEKVDSGPLKCNKLSIKSPIGMFKKKLPAKKDTNLQEISPVISPVISDSTDQRKHGHFVPSSFAGETYKKYLEKSKLQEHVKENIWACAERQMKDIEANKYESQN